MAELTTIKALTSFTGLQGKFREGEVGNVTISYAAELVKLGLAEETSEEPSAKLDKSDKTANSRKTKPKAGAEKTKDAQ